MDCLKKLLCVVLMVFLTACSTFPRGESHNLVGTVIAIEHLHYDVIKKEPFQECVDNSKGQQECHIYYKDVVYKEYKNYRVTYDANGFQGTIVTYRKYEVGDRFKVQIYLNPSGGVANHRN